MSNYPLGKRLGIMTLALLSVAVIIGIYPIYFQVNNISLLLMTVFICLVLGVWFLIFSKKNGMFTLKYVDAMWAYVGFIVVLFVTIFFHPGYKNFLASMEYPTVGILTLVLLGLLFMVIINAQLSKRDIFLWVGIFCIALFVAAVVQLFQLLGRIDLANSFFGGGFVPTSYIVPFAYLLLAVSIGGIYFVAQESFNKTYLLFLTPILTFTTGFSTFLLLNVYDLSFGLFTPFGIAVTLIVVCVLVILWLTKFKDVFSKGKSLFIFISTILVSLGLAFYFNSIKDKFETLANFGISAMPIKYAWDLTVDAVSANIQTLFTGVGPGIDSIVFMRYRDLTMFMDNMIPEMGFVWVGPLINTLLVSFGIFGFIAFLIVIGFIIKQIIFDKSQQGTDPFSNLTGGLTIASLIMLLGLLIIPAPIQYALLLVIVLGVTFSAYYIVNPGKEKTLTLKLSMSLDEGVTNKQKFSGAIEFAVGILGLICLLYFGSLYARRLWAESLYIKTVEQYEVDQTKTYSNINKALTTVDELKYYTVRNTFLFEDLVKLISDDPESTSIAVIVEELIEGTERMVEKYPLNYEAWEFRGNVFAQLNLLSENDPYSTGAINAYNQSLSLNPININLRITLADFYSSIGNYQEAYTLYTDLKSTFPVLSYDIDLRIARIYLSMGDFDKATEIVNKLMESIDTMNAEGTITADEAQKLKDELTTALTQIEALKDGSTTDTDFSE
ncbi:tetratricopeptide repeat protein [Candidatus Dojkabacteria bacterium]|nr:tetratricopeptide repeat protein [Candidatus Dojkabacteria bacterium]